MSEITSEMVEKALEYRRLIDKAQRAYESNRIMARWLYTRANLAGLDLAIMITGKIMAPSK